MSKIFSDQSPLSRVRYWIGKTIARKLLFAFFAVFIVTYLATALVIQGEIRAALTETTLDTLSQTAQLRLDGINAQIESLATNLNSWARMDVMNDLASGDIDRRISREIDNLKIDYDLKGNIYAFNAPGQLVASSTKQNSQPLVPATLPDFWKTSGAEVNFIDKHRDPFGQQDIVALSVPVMLASANYRLGTLVLTYPWHKIQDRLGEQTVLLRHREASGQPESAAPNQDRDKLFLLESTLKNSIPAQLLSELAHRRGWLNVGKEEFLVNSATNSHGLLSDWQVVVFTGPQVLQQTLSMVVLRLALLCAVLSIPLILAIYWLARKLTFPLRELTRFVSEIAETQDLSRRLELGSHDELGILAHAFGDMTMRLDNGLKVHRADEMRLRTIIDAALDAVVLMDAEGKIAVWNDQAAFIFGWNREEAVGRMLDETIIPQRNREAHIHGMQRYLVSKVLNNRIEITGLHRDGHEFPIEIAVTLIRVSGNYEFSAFIRDITGKKESEELIWKQANYDTLTGLPNRRMFHDRLEQEVKKAHRAGMIMALMFLDLDRFKEVNDTLGHEKGDILLQEAARRISACVRESDTVARLGGDEFTVILSEIADTNSVERVANDILQKLVEPFRLGNEMAHVSVSIGITMYPVDATEVSDLLKDADQAMYVAKESGRNCLAYFTPELQEAAQNRLRMQADLREAIEGDQFMVYYQPIVELASGSIYKAEALIRWRHPVLGMVSPADFIPLAEDTGLIIPIGDWVFKKAAQQVRQWRERYAANFQVSVNKSPVQFRSNATSLAVWTDYLREIGVPGSSIVVELTEGLLLDAASGISDKLLEFRDAGIHIAIDDFGTGYSSLSYLKKFDIDFLKIDQSFVRDLETDPKDVALCEAIIVMAHKLGFKVIAEGVENQAQRHLLVAAGCDYAQGYLYSRPVPPEEFEKLLGSANSP
jgi:diguanylate cyclase (GGDEF)-like protein/PAS domain S-box-containing protein